MKKSLSLLLFCVISLYSISQDSFYKIENSGSQYSSTQIADAFKNSNFCGMINPSVDYTITFDDGTVVTILSSNKIEINNECVRQNDLTDTSIWYIKEGILIKAAQSANNKKS